VTPRTEPCYWTGAPPCPWCGQDDEDDESDADYADAMDALEPPDDDDDDWPPNSWKRWGFSGPNEADGVA